MECEKLQQRGKVLKIEIGTRMVMSNRLCRKHVNELGDNLLAALGDLLAKKGGAT